MINRLKEIANVFRKDEIDFLELTIAIKDFESIVLEISDVNIDDETNRSDLHFETGKALGTTWAAHCIKDLIRTRNFVKGLFEAIEKVQATCNGPVLVLYAGTGPFATLALPVMATFSPDEVQFILLEINENSFESMSRVIDKLGFGHFIHTMEIADATNYIIDQKVKPDIVISETMQCALAKEQQVSISMNLLSQLNDEVIMIPENISLELCLMKYKNFENRIEGSEEDHLIRLGKIFELNKESVRVFKKEVEKGSGKFSFPEKRFIIPKEHIENFNCLVVLTEIQVYNNTKISITQSGLTTPLILEYLSGQSDRTVIQMNYTIDKEPGIRYNWN